MDPNKKYGKAAAKGNEEEEQREENSEDSSIGINSDDEEGDGGSSEVQSSGFGSLSTLDDALPRSKSLSKFYDGAERSYSNLAEALVSESAKDIAKSNNPHKRKLQNAIARNIMLGAKSLKKSDGEGIRKGVEMSSFEGNTENLASSASLRHVPSRLGIESLFSHESSSSASQNASTFTPGPSSSSFDLHGVAAADESNSRLRRDSSSTSFQSATAVAATASDNTPRPDNSSTDLQTAVADDGSDPDRRLNNSTTSSNKGVDTTEPQK